MTRVPLARLYRLILSGLLLLSTASLQAETLVLIHGYLSKGMDWRMRGIVPILQQDGWNDGGHLSYGPTDILTATANTQIKGNTLYTIDLPWQSTIQTQSLWLKRYIDYLYLQRQEPIVLIAHSAGGIVSRLLLVNALQENAMPLPIHTLITIASPHLGTPNADLSLLASDSPLGELASFMGISELQKARGLYKDLRVETPGNFLYWLNRQAHPLSTRYVSLVRLNDDPQRMDYVVPSRSQDMRNIPQLAPYAKTFYTQGTHFLSEQDGVFVTSLLHPLTYQ